MAPAMRVRSPRPELSQRGGTADTPARGAGDREVVQVQFLSLGPLAPVAEQQTREVQALVLARAWGCKSLPEYQRAEWILAILDAAASPKRSSAGWQLSRTVDARVAVDGANARATSRSTSRSPCRVAPTSCSTTAASRRRFSFTIARLFRRAVVASATRRRAHWLRWVNGARRSRRSRRRRVRAWEAAG